MKLSEAIAQVPTKHFFLDRGEDRSARGNPRSRRRRRRPNYKSIFVFAVAALLDSRKAEYDPATLEAVAEHVNLSTFQRQVATERARRNGGGEPVQRPAKVKKARPNSIDGGIRKRVDPITGQPHKRAAKKGVQTAAEKLAAMVAARKAKSPWTKKNATPKGVPTRAPRTEDSEAVSAPAQPDGEIDPITGDAAAE